MTRIGVQIPVGPPWADVVGTVHHLERLGVDVVWLGDHLVSWGDPAAPRFEAWSALAALARETSRIRLGTLVTQLTYRNPVLLAREALTVDHLSDGRLEVGIGAGGAPTDYEASGVGPWDPDERVARLEEGVDILDRLLRGELLQHAGTHYRAGNVVMRPAPIQRPRPPITVAALAAPAIRVAARHADAWNTYGSSLGKVLSAEAPAAGAGFERVRRRIETFRAACAEAGRDAADVRISVCTGSFELDGERPWASKAAFDDVVGRYAELGATELVFFYPVEPGFPPGSVQHGAFEEFLGPLLEAQPGMG